MWSSKFLASKIYVFQIPWLRNSTPSMFHVSKNQLFDGITAYSMLHVAMPCQPKDFLKESLWKSTWRSSSSAGFFVHRIPRLRKIASFFVHKILRFRVSFAAVVSEWKMEPVKACTFSIRSRSSPSTSSSSHANVWWPTWCCDLCGPGGYGLRGCCPTRRPRSRPGRALSTMQALTGKAEMGRRAPLWEAAQKDMCSAPPAGGAPRRPGSARARLPPVPEVPETVKRSGRATCVSPYRLPTVFLPPSYHLPTLFLPSSYGLPAISLPSSYRLRPVLGTSPCRPAAVCLAPAYRHPTVALPTRYPASAAMLLYNYFIATFLLPL